MRAPVYSSQFERDVKRQRKRDKKMGKLKSVIQLILAGQPLPARYKDHPLKHNWAGCRDAHVEPDWVLIYTISEHEVRFERTGTHEELFDKL
jgi:mRNA interferase YafQ